MKKINKLIISGVGILSLLVPMSAKAATLEYDNAKKTNEKGVLKLPIVLTVAESEAVSGLDLICKVDDLDVTCSFEKGESTFEKEGMFTYLDSGSPTNFPTGKTTIGYLVLTNSQAITKNVGFSIDSKSGKYKIETLKSSITPKEEARVKSSDAALSSLKVSQGTMTPDFSSDVTEYTIYGITDTINSVNMNYECKASGCEVAIDAPAGVNGRKVNLNQGSNKVEVNVTSEDGTNSKKYILNILRGETGYNSAKLSSLSFGDYTLTPSFKRDVTEYSLMVPSSVTSVIGVLKFEKEDTNAKEALNGFDNFIIGENKATITIDNVNGDETTTYTINITRMSDTQIEVLKYKDNKITFRDSEGIQNTLDEDEFKVQYADEWEKIRDKTYKFDEDGNLITDEEEKSEEKEEKKKNNTWIIVALIVTGLLIIGVSGFFIFKKKKPNDKDDSNDSENNGTEEKKDNEDLENTTEIDENGIEEEIIKNEKEDKENDTMDIDEALVDLMSTKKYDFKDED